MNRLGFLLSFLLVFSITINSKAQSVAISEIMYHCDASISSGNWIEIYNYGTTTADITGWKLTKASAITPFVFPAGTSIAAGEYLVIVNNPPSFAAQYPTVSNFIGTLPFGANNRGDTLLLLNASNVLVETVAYLDTFPWSFGADGGGNSLERIDIPASSSVASNWFDGCIGGSPGTSYTSCSYPIIFSEVNYNSDSLWDAGNWVEIRNVSNSAVNIGNWIFMDKKDTVTHQFVIPTGTTLAAHDNYVLYQDVLLFNARFPSIPAAKKAGPFNFNFSNRGELLRLYDNSGELQFSLRYDDVAPWPAGADGIGYTLDVQDSTGNLNDGSKWATTCKNGTPAAYTRLPCTSGIEDGLVQNVSVWPNPVSSELHIESERWLNKIELLDILGNRVLFASDVKSSNFTLSVDGLPIGLYFLKLDDLSLHKIAISR